MRQGTILLVSALGLLLTGCVATTEQQFSPEADCVGEECQRAPDGVDAPDAPSGGGGPGGGGTPH